MNKWFVVAAWNICLAIVILGAAEVGLRYTAFEAARHPAAALPAGYYSSDETLGISITPNSPQGRFVFRGPGHDIFSNELGCFDKPVSLKPAQPYILALGDSFTWGYNALEAKWTSILERRTGVRVVKCGVSGTGTRYQIELMKRLLARLPHAPSIVIHLYDTTDFNDDFTFPGENVVAGHRTENFDRIRLSDGLTIPRKGAKTAQGFSVGGTASKTGSVLAGIVQMGLLLDSRVEKRRLLLEGNNPAFLNWKYEYNLLLLDDTQYPYVARQLDAHLDALREMRDLATGAGAAYAVFHTNSFRLPDELPLVRRLDTYLEGIQEFQGRIPEMERHLFDPHWSPESEERVAEFMLERLKSNHYLDFRARLSRRETRESMQ